MKRLLILLCLLCLPAAALAGYPPAVPYGDLFVRTETLNVESTLSVFTGPGAEYLRGANGKAAVAPADWVQVFGTENGYTLVQYEVDFLCYRFGWVQGEYTDAPLGFYQAVARITRDAALTDDPLGQRGTLCTLFAGTDITWLASMGSAWIYVEAETGGAPVRGFVLRDHIELLEPETVYAGKLYPIRENGLWGYMDYQGNVAIAPRFASAGEFRGAGYAEAIAAGKDWENGGGIINTRGEWMVEPLYCIDNGYDGWLYGDIDTGVVWIWQRDEEGSNSLDGFFDFASGYFSGLRFLCNVPWVSETDNLIAVSSPDVEDVNNYGFVDRSTGETVVDFRFGDIVNPMYFSEGYTSIWIWIADDNDEIERYCIIDKTGEELPLPDDVCPDAYCGGHFKEGLLSVFNETYDICGFINTKGELVIPLRYSNTDWGFSEGLCAVEYNGKWGYINHDGDWVIKPGFDRANPFRHGVAVVTRDERFLLISRTGQTLYDFGTDWTYVDFSDYGVAVTTDGLMIDTQGNVLVPASAPYSLAKFAYDYTFDSYTFEEGLQAMVNQEGMMGYFDTEGKPAIPFVWDEAYRFRNGLAEVMRDGRMAYINHAGEVVWQEQNAD